MDISTKNTEENAKRDPEAEAMRSAGSTAKKTGTGMQVAGKAAKLGGGTLGAAGRVAEYSGKGLNKGGDLALKAGGVLSRTGIGAIAGVPLMAAGGAAKGAGMVAEGGGKLIGKTGDAIRKGGDVVDKSGKALRTSGKFLKRTADAKERFDKNQNDSLNNQNNFAGKLGGFGNNEKYAPLAQRMNPYVNEKQDDISKKGENSQREGGYNNFDPNRKSALNQARAKSKVAQAINAAKLGKDLAKNATPWGVASLLKHIDWFKDWLYFFALLLAMAKDLVDLIGIGSLPALGTVISICCSIMIFLLMLLAGSGGTKKFAKKFMNKYLVLLGGTMSESFLFGLNFLPLETITVVIVYIMVLMERKQEKEAEEKEKALGNAGDDEEDEYD